MSEAGKMVHHANSRLALTAILGIGVAAAACSAAWLQLGNRDEPGAPADLLVASKVQQCGKVSAGAWSAAGKAGRDWLLSTNLTSCATPLNLMGDIAGRDMVSIAAVDGFRCTASHVVAGKIVSGICYADTVPSAYFTWGANVAPFNDTAACPVCTGVPGQSVADVFKQHT